MQGCHHQARRAKENSPVIDHWVRVSLCPKSRPGRKHRQTPTSHQDAANLNPNSEGGQEIEPTCREPIVGRARHSVRAAPATSACKISRRRLPDPLPIKREPPVVGGVALRLRLPAEQALCGDAMPIGARMFSSPRRVCGSGAGPATKTPESTETGRNNTIITMNERLQTRVARATGPYRPATRRTERVRRSFCQRTSFVICASSFFRHLTFVIRHSQTETIKNPRNITFYSFETAPHNYPTHHRQPMAGRARHSVRAAPATSACKISPASPSRPAADQDLLEFPVPTSEFGLNPEPDRLKPETFNLKPCETPEISHFTF